MFYKIKMSCKHELLIEKEPGRKEWNRISIPRFRRSIMSHFSNINTYISYSCTSLTEANYNEVDALVFAQLAYFPFETTLADYKTRRISVPEYAAIIMKRPDFVTAYSSDKQTFIKELANCKRYTRCFMHDMQAIATADTQWAAFTADIGSWGTSIVAMRGTDGTTVGWEEDFRLAHNVMGTGAQLASFRYLKEVQAKKVYLTGHSKGGNNVSSAYVMSNPYIRDKVVRIDNFDGPGVNPEFAGNYADGYDELRKKLNNFYPQDSIIGLLLQDNPGNTFFIKSMVREDYGRNPILGQHDPFSFMVKGNAFEKTGQTYISQTLNHILEGMVEATTNKQRYYLVQFLERIGVPALISGESEGMPQYIARGICNAIKAPREEKEALFQTLIIFIKSFIDSAKEWIAQRQWRGYNKTVVKTV